MAKEIDHGRKVLLREAATTKITYRTICRLVRKKQDILEAIRDHRGDRRRGNGFR